jgi:L-threonylcarbamoyladenylate synthase
MILDGHSPDAIERTAQALASGCLAGIPTETVYGLAADAMNEQAIGQIYAVKGRPVEHPLIVHVTGKDSVQKFAASIPTMAQRLMDAFWPGPLTLILPRKVGVASAAAGGQNTIGVRSPSHPVTQALLTACQAHGVIGLAAPSANRFGRVSATTATHVTSEFGTDLLVLDGGPCSVGVESAIVDCTRFKPVLLRPGQLTRVQLEQVTGQRILMPGGQTSADPRAPGTLAAHYAPRATVRVMNENELSTALSLLGERASGIAVWARSKLPTTKGVTLRSMPDDPKLVAQQLFAVLRNFDDAGVKLIWVETLPDGPDWEAIADRLRRAQASVKNVANR